MVFIIFQTMVVFFINFYNIYLYNFFLINIINFLELIDNYYFNIFIFSFFLNTLCFNNFYSFNFYYLFCLYYIVFIFMFLVLLFCLYFYYENSTNDYYILFLINKHCKSKMIGYLMNGFGFGCFFVMFIFVNLFLFVFFYLPCLFLFFFIILVVIISPIVFFINYLYVLKISYLESEMWEFKIFNKVINFYNTDLFKNFNNSIYYFFLCSTSDFFYNGVFIMFLFEFFNEFLFIFVNLFLFVFFMMYFKQWMFNMDYKLYIFNFQLSCVTNYFLSFIFYNISIYKFFFNDFDFFKSLGFNFNCFMSSFYFSNIIKPDSFVYFYLCLFIYSFYVNFNFLFVSESFFSFILLVLIVKNVSSLYNLTIKYFKCFSNNYFCNNFSDLYFFVFKLYKLNKNKVYVLFCVLGLGDSFLYYFYYFHNFFISWKFYTYLNVFITFIVLGFSFGILFIQKFSFMMSCDMKYFCLGLNWFYIFKFYIFIQKFGLIIFNFIFLFYIFTNYFIFFDILYFFVLFIFSFFNYSLFIYFYYDFYFKIVFQFYMCYMSYFNYFLYIVYFTISLDVMHSISWDFVNWGSSFGFKLDVIPGKINYFFLDCLDISFVLYSLTCFEFCGLYHSYMKLDCLVLDLDMFTMLLLWDS